jgi:hypothetical protein
VGEQAADGFHVLRVHRDPEQLLELGHRQPRRDPGGARREPLHRRALGVVLVGDLPHDLLKDVLDRDQAGGAAVLVDDDRHVDPHALHLPQQLVHRLAVRHVGRRAHDLLDPLGRQGLAGVRVLLLPGDDVLQVGDPDHVVDALADDGDAGETAAQRQRQRLVEGLVPLDEHHVGARHHDLADDRVAQFEHRPHHVALAWLDLGLALDVVDEAAHFRPPAEFGIAAARAKGQHAGQPAKQPRQRAQRPAQRAEQHGRGPGHLLGALLAQGPRPDADQDVRGDEQRARRGQEHLPAAAEPVRERQRHQDRGGHLGADPDQGQQAAVGFESVRVGPDHRVVRGRAPARDEDQRGRRYQEPPCRRHQPGPS